MIVKSYELKNNLKDEIDIYLLYGENIDLIDHVINKDIKKKFSKNLYNYEEAEVLSNRDTFKINLFNKSFFDNEKLIIINRVSDKILDLIIDILEKKSYDIKIILKAGILEKKSKLRKYFEKNKNLLAVPFYEDNYQSLFYLAQNFFKENKIKISTQSINYILEKSKGSRVSLKNELEKIKSYTQKKLSIDLNDIIRITNSAEDYKISELIDQCLAKNKDKTINILNENSSSIENNILIVKTFLYKLKRLKKLKKEIKINRNYNQVISSFRPPIFWKDKDIVNKQLKNLSTSEINVLIKKINSLELLIKKNSNLSNEITNNFIFETMQNPNNLI